MRELTDRHYWNALYEGEALTMASRRDDRDGARPTAKRLARVVKALLGPRLVGAMRSYVEYRLWETIYDRYMPRSPGATVVEIGSAPGVHLVQLHDRYGFVPYGIERSETGVEVHRRLFAAHDIDPQHVIHADFLADEVRRRYRECFDVVLSRGFIEHFTDPRGIVARHLELLKPGGHLFLGIPNLRGLNYALSWFFDRPALAMHNVDIMSRERFLTLFDANDLSLLHCDYYGTFDFGLFTVPSGSPRRHALEACRKVQLLLNLAFRTLFGAKGAESRYLSPYLMYVGVKRRVASEPAKHTVTRAAA